MYKAFCETKGMGHAVLLATGSTLNVSLMNIHANLRPLGIIH